MRLKKLYNALIYTKIDEGLDFLLRRKPKDKVLLKAAEELTELSLAIIQHLSKGESEDHIKEEIIDVFLNLEILCKYYTKEEMLELLQQKGEKFLQSKDFKTYA